MRFIKGRSRKSIENKISETDRKHAIWEDSSLIEELFSDSQWEKLRYSRNNNEVPSKKMEKHIINRLSEIQEEETKKLKRTNTVHLLLSYSATACILAFILFGIIQNHETSSYTSKNVLLKQSAANPWKEIINSETVLQTIILPDSSTLQLYSNSRIKYKISRHNGPREIHLTGKAHFSVKKNKSRPFCVYTAQTKTTALGTSFTIDTNDDAESTSIELHSGKVVVASTMTNIDFKPVYLLHKGDRLTFDHVSNKIQTMIKPDDSRSHKRIPNLKQQTPDTSSIIRFNNRPIADVFNLLEEAYHANIMIQDADISQILYTGVLNTTEEDLPDILTVICLINDLEYISKGQNRYTITRKNSKNKTYN